MSAFTTRLPADWPDGPPDWIVALAEACDRTSQRQAAEAIGYSASAVSTVLRARYPGDVGRVESAVRGAFMAATVDCPVLGEIPTTRCLHEQVQPYAATNHVRVRLYRACPSCRHNRKGGANNAV